MTSIQRRPNSDIATSGWNAVGAGGASGVTADGNLATYVYGTGNPTPDMVLGIASYTLNPTDRCKAVKVEFDFQPQSGIGATVPVDFSPGWHSGAGDVWNAKFRQNCVGMGIYGGPILTTDGKGAEWDQARLNALRVRFATFNGFDVGRILSVYFVLDIRHKPTLTVNLPNGAQTTRKPTVTWTPNTVDGEAQKKAQIRVFTTTQIAAGGFNPATSTPVFDSGQIAITTASYTLPVMLPDDTFRAYVRIAKDFNGQDWWSDYAFSPTFGITNPPPSPTNVTPANGATANTDMPTLAATLRAPSLGARVKAQWQLATDSSFATNLRTFTEDNTKLRASGSTFLGVDVTNQLFQGTWYLRAREIDEFGTVGAWSSTQSFTVSHPPSAIAPQPSGGLVRSWGASTPPGLVTFDWTFGDTSPVDFQTAYQIILEENDTGIVLTDTGKVVSNLETAQILVAAVEQDVPLRWKIRLWDSDDVAGSYSSYNIFTLGEGPDITIISPADGTEVDNPTPTVTFDFTVLGGRFATQFAVLIYDDVTQLAVYNSGWQTLSSSTGPIAWTPEVPTLTNDHDYTVWVDVKDNAGLVGVMTSAIHTHWIPPAAPAVTVDTSEYTESGYVAVSWNALSEDGEFTAWRVYRRREDEVAWTKLVETDALDFNFTLHDWSAAAQTAYQYAVVQVVLRFGVQVESDYVPISASVGDSYYWFIDPNDAGANFKLQHVTSDQFTDEWEQTDHKIINRGRKTDYGTHWGYTGTLNAKLYDEPYASAIELWKRFRNTKSALDEVYLRNPFGDMWLVTIGDVGVSRIAGVGPRAFVELTVPYSQVAD